MTDPDTSAEWQARAEAVARDCDRAHELYKQAGVDGSQGAAWTAASAATLRALAARLAAAEAELRQRHGDTYTVNPAAEWQARAEAAEADVARMRAEAKETAGVVDALYRRLQRAVLAQKGEA